MLDEDENDETLDMRKAIDGDVTLLKEVSDARHREAKFWEVNCAAFHGGSNPSQAEDQRVEEVDNKEWGIEVNEHIGPHESIKTSS